MKKKLELQFKPKKIDLGADKSSWERAFFWTVSITLGVFLLGCLYIIFKPIPEDLKTLIDSEIQDTNVTFDKKTLDMIKQRLELPPTEKPTIGKDPFAS